MLEAGKLREALFNIRFTLASTAVNFVWTPLLTFVLGLLFLGGEPDLQMGLMMLMIAPCTDWYLIFTGLTRGDVELGASVLPVNLILQFVLLPFYLYVFFGGTARVDVAELVLVILFVLALPCALAALFRLAGRKAGAAMTVLCALKRISEPAQLVCLCLAILAMLASESNHVLENPSVFVLLLVPVLLFFAVNLAAGRLLGRALGMGPAETTALNFTTLARNSPLSLTIAVAAFPEKPLVAFVLVAGVVIELPVLSFIAELLRRYAAGGKAEV